MAGDKKSYRLDDFRIGEYVIPKDGNRLPQVIVSLDRERNLIICRLATERSVHAYFPHELEKENKELT